jgi:NAD(P)-dependent dehydrogenase (short-subunit alcohol dehydrogenase family)
LKIAGEIAVVTGAASGLGAATARMLAQAGAKVAVLDLDETGAGAVASEIGGLAARCDVSDEASVEAAFVRIGARLGAGRILVNCAGVAPAARIVGRNGPMPLAEFRRVIDVNLIGTFDVMRRFAAEAMRLEPLEEGERAVIVNTASVAAFEGQVGQAAYASSKGAVAALTLPAARELAGSGIRVNAIAPGTFETTMLAAMPDAVRESLAAAVPFPPRLGRAEEYARLAVHIIENVMLNGTVIRLDGALRMAAK